MTVDEFALAATTNDLTREPKARDAADLLEFRLDSADEPIEQLAEYDGELPILATNRSRWFGGEANDRGRLDQLMAAAEFDAVEKVDVELETARGMQWVLEEFRDQDVELVISFHEFDETPSQEVLDAIIAECAEYGDIAKVATYAEDRSDCLRILSAIDTATQQGIRAAGIAMGELGSHTRVIGPLYGSALGYAPLESDSSEYAPGQIPLHRIDSLIKMIDESGADSRIFDQLDEEYPTQQEVTQTE
ncbi:type I 3-dehydroquinate dehydratase [Natronolimnohabitans innermongolicus]|uniref:3-dehydroquinate dehydratase n=1 Tax=Natronolimnohabitans innermongolicus JCM 12255 TaxID=1227499 RepID=L9XCW8_9EURY|nr:type I 3-dehydroquinate dehydratase [Natronolimnohabitans innermongolicus]ELY59580.1 3-dehydroquinate dehydratase [Natronolimnohabitans innermongolicus JCM 12255]